MAKQTHPTPRKPDSAAAPLPPPPRGLYVVTATLTGFVIMALELTAFRLYAPYFGYSLYVWGSMIGVAMAALAAGYAVGGWAADRARSDRPLYAAITLAAAYQLAILFVAHDLLDGLARLGEVNGPLLATIIIFAPPMTLLAVTSPFVTRLLAPIDRVGSTTGRVSAASTVGSLAGVFVASFWLVPTMGVRFTLAAACALTAVVGVGGLFRTWRAAPVLLLPLVLLFNLPVPYWEKTAVWHTESPYNLVRVHKEGELTYLVLNSDTARQTSRTAGGGMTRGRYYDDFALGPVLVNAKRALILGMGGGTSISTTRVTAPGLEFDAVEIDPKVVEAAVRFFDLPIKDPKLHVHTADARPWLAANRHRYDIVQLDLYQGGPYIPFYLATTEFFTSVRAHMTDDAVLMMNVLDVSDGRELLYATAATLKKVYPSVLHLTHGSGNHFLFCFSRPRTLDEVRATLNEATVTPDASYTVSVAADKIAEIAPPAGTPVFTDDRAPIEPITRRALADRFIRTRP